MLKVYASLRDLLSVLPWALKVSPARFPTSLSMCVNRYHGNFLFSPSLPWWVTQSQCLEAGEACVVRAEQWTEL